MAGPSLTPTAEMAAAQGAPTYLGTINFGAASLTNVSAGTPFNTGGLDGKVLLLHNAATADARVYGVASGGSVTNSRGAGFGVVVTAGSRVTLRLDSGRPFLAAIDSAGGAGGNLDVYEMT